MNIVMKVKSKIGKMKAELALLSVVVLLGSTA